MSSSYIIIGASGGIGSQLVADLESCGHNLLLGYHKEKLDAISGNSEFAPVEATNFDSVMSLVEQGVNKFGDIDGLINLPGKGLANVNVITADMNDFDIDKNFDIENISYDDQKVFKLLSTGNTVGMSVMNGFRAELVNKIVGFNSHVIIQSNNIDNDIILTNSEELKNIDFVNLNAENVALFVLVPQDLPPVLSFWHPKI